MSYYAESFLQEARMSLAGGVLTGLGENRVAFVSREDVAAAAAGILTSEGHAGAIYNATRPESLTGAERAALVAEASGQPFSFLVLPEPVLRQGLGGRGCRLRSSGRCCRSRRSSCRAASTSSRATSSASRDGSRAPLRELVAGAFAGS